MYIRRGGSTILPESLAAMSGTCQMQRPFIGKKILWYCRCHSDTRYDSPGTHRKRDCRYVLDPAGIQKHFPLSTRCCQKRESRPSCGNIHLMCYRGIPVGVNPGRYLHLFLGPLPHILLCLEVIRIDTLNQRKKIKKCIVKRVRCTR